jgi:aspartyl-tRNA(Asn)/glutamyl-tRNA(Gln) amidotransferase subunit A
MNRLIVSLRQKGWQIDAQPLPPAAAEIVKYHRQIMSAESAQFHRERLQRYPDDYPTKITELLREGLSFSAMDILNAQRHQADLRLEVREYFPSAIAAYLAPATQDPPPDTSTTGPNTFQAPWSYMGLPTVSLPFAWTDDGLPLCVQLAGNHWSEDELLATAMELEKDIGFERREVPG